MMDEENEHACPQCGALLRKRDDGFWCETNKKLFGAEEVVKNNEWRSLSVMAKVERFKALGAEETARKYFLRMEQLDEIRKLAAEAAAVVKTKREVVTPEKGSLISLARAVTDEAALCELIDNAVDAGKRKRPGELVTVHIALHKVLRRITVEDDAGGMDREDMRRCFTLGAQKLDTMAVQIGRYGIGAKESIYHFGREVIVRSHLRGADSGIRTIVSEDWLDNPDWTIDIQEGLQDIPEGTTSIEIGRLESTTLRNVDELRRHIGHTYERLIAEKTLVIILEGESVTEGLEYVALFPPHLFPRTYRMRSARVNIVVRAMLIHKPADASGMVFYAQGRRYAHLPWSSRRVRMLIDKVPKSTLREHIRVEIEFEGPIEDIPINATKDDLTENALLTTIAPLVSRIVSPYFNAITPLSQERAMGFVNTITKEHPKAESDHDDIVFGRVGDTTKIPAEKLADVARFKEFLAREGTTTEPCIVLNPEHNPKADPAASGDGGRVTLGNGGALGDDEAFQRFEGRLLVIYDSTAKRKQVEDWLDDGRRIGVEIVEE